MIIINVFLLIIFWEYITDCYTSFEKKKEEEVDSTPLLKVNNLKIQRNIDENKLKVKSVLI